MLYKSQVVLRCFQISDYDGFQVHSVLSVPIRNSEERVIGVVQLMNKINGKPFTETDINVVEVRHSRRLMTSYRMALDNLLIDTCGFCYMYILRKYFTSQLWNWNAVVLELERCRCFYTNSQHFSRTSYHSLNNNHTVRPPSNDITH